MQLTQSGGSRAASERIQRGIQERLAANARRLRAERGWNQQETAWRSRVAVRMYQTIEGGGANPTFGTVARLCAAFEVDVRDLLAPSTMLPVRVGRPPTRALLDLARDPFGPHAGSSTPVAKKILVVDGHVAGRDALQLFLDREGYTVAVASTARVGLQRMRRERFDVVLCSEELAHHPTSWMLSLASDKAPRATVLLANDGAEVPPYSENGTVLRKPLDLEDLLQVIDRLLAVGRVARPASRSSHPPRRLLAEKSAAMVQLALYVTESSAASRRAARNLERILADYDRSQITLKVFDMAKDRVDERDRVAFTPTLVKRAPAPRAWLLGDLRDRNAVAAMLQGAGLRPIR